MSLYRSISSFIGSLWFMSVIFRRSIFYIFSNSDFFSDFENFDEQFSLNSYLKQVIFETTLNHSLEPVKTIKINPSVSTLTVSDTLALYDDRFYALDFTWKLGVLHNTGACRKYAVNKVIYNYREGGNVHLELLTGRNV